MHLGNRPIARDLLERDRGLRRQALGCETGAPKSCRQCHRKTAGMRGRDEFFRIRAVCSLEAGGKGIRRVLEYPTVGGERTLALLEIAMPNRRCRLLHDRSPDEAAR